MITDKLKELLATELKTLEATGKLAQDWRCWWKHNKSVSP